MDVESLIAFDLAMPTHHHLFQFDWWKDAREYAARCEEHGCRNEDLVLLVDAFHERDEVCFFRIGREYSRVFYAMTRAELGKQELIDLALLCGCDEADEYASNWPGCHLYRFWWD